jgi:endoglycosylceramidase
MARDDGHRSFDDFFADVDGVRTRFLRTIDRVAFGFAATPGVIGYDLLNEPWGDEKRELGPLYREMAGVIRARHPSAILFLEGHVTTNCGKGTRLTTPSFGDFAYAPHYYKPITLVLNAWRGSCLPIDHAFAQMNGQSERWACPLFLGEFGVAATAKNAGDYVDAIYDRLDASLASGAQWNLTPGWDARKKDGWNGEDFSIVDAAGNLRPNFRPRPYPRLTAGTPTRFEYRERHSSASSWALLFSWDNCPERGETLIALPDGLFRPGTRVETTPTNIIVSHDPARRALVCRSSFRGPITLRMSEPAIQD